MFCFVYFFVFWASNDEFKTKPCEFLFDNIDDFGFVTFFCFFFLLLSHEDCFYWFFANSLSENFIWLLSLSNVLGTHNQTENFFFFTSLLHSENKGNRTKVELFYIETILLVIIVIIVNWLITYRAFRIEYFKLFVNLFI